MLPHTKVPSNKRIPKELSVVMGKMVRNLLNVMMIVLIIVQVVVIANNPSFSSLCPHQLPLI